MTRLIRIAVLAALVVLSAGRLAVAADLVVVSSTAPGMHAGQIVDAGTDLTIPAGASVTLINESGQAKTLTGPHAGPAGLGVGVAGDDALVDTLAGLFKAPGQDVMSLGVMRSAPPPPPPPTDPWVIDTTRNGHHCVPSDATARLWRADAARAQTLIVTSKDADGAEARIDWPRGTETVNWPANVSVREGGTYMIRAENGRLTRRIVLHSAPAGLASNAHAAAWMARAGCRQQAQTLASAIR